MKHIQKRQIDATDRQTDERVCDRYDLKENEIKIVEKSAARYYMEKAIFQANPSEIRPYFGHRTPENLTNGHLHEEPVPKPVGAAEPWRKPVERRRCWEGL